MLKQTQAATVRAVVGVWLGLAAFTGAATVTWDGSGTPNNGGSWQTLTNWSGDAKPLAANNAQLADVTSGTRVVTVDAIETINQLTMTQTTVGAVNKLLLNNPLAISGNATPLSINAAAGTGSLVLDLNGNTLTVSCGADFTPTFNGTVNMGPGSQFSMQQNNAQAGMIFTANGSLAQDSSTVTYWYSGGNNGGIERKFVNTGTWSLINNAAYVESGGFRMRDDSSNSGTLSVLSGSTLSFPSLTNTGYLELGTNARLGRTDGSTLNNTATGTFNVTGTNAAFGGGSGTSTVTNSGTMNLGVSGIPAGLIIDANAPAFSNPGTLNIVPGSTITLQFRPQSTESFSNAGTTSMDNVTLTFNLTGGNRNNNNVSFNNSGLWTLQNSSQVIGMGYNMSGGNINGFNSGTLNVLSNSSLGAYDLTNTGTLQLGSGSSVGGADNYATLYNNSGGTVNITGNALIGHTFYGSNNTASVVNGAAGTGSQFNIGNGSNTPVLTLEAYNASFTNNAGNTVTVAAGATLAMLTNATGDDHNFRDHTTIITNGGTWNLAGKVQFAPNNTYPTITNTGTLVVGGTAAVIERLVNSRPSNYYVTMLNNNAGGTLNGSGTLTYTNSSGNALVNKLTLTNAGTIAPGNSVGALTLVNTNVTFASGGKLSMDINGSPGSGQFDVLTLSGLYAGALDLSTAGDILDITLGPSYYSQINDTFHIVNTTATPSGTFDVLRFFGTPRADVYQVLTSSSGVDIKFLVSIPEPASLALLGLAGLALARRRRASL